MSRLYTHSPMISSTVENVTTLEQVFNEKEISIINKCVENQQFSSIVTMLETSMPAYAHSPQKENALQAHLNTLIRPQVNEESAVRRELHEKESKGYRIETPEQEAYWQQRLDEEKASLKIESLPVKTEMSSPATEIASALSVSVKDSVTETAVATSEPLGDDLSEVELTRDEIKKELLKRGIEFKPNLSKPELLDLLQAKTEKI